jgi:hypothetical protein
VDAGGHAPAARTWLANTDADSTVPPDWLAGMLARATSGADLVLGTVSLTPDAQEGLASDWRDCHPPHEGHHYVYGANFGIRADAYVQLGGWPELVTGEDVALAAHAADSGGLHIVRWAATPVLTSARLQARAPSGLSSYLHRLSNDRASSVRCRGASAVLKPSEHAGAESVAELGRIPIDLARAGRS